MCFKRQVTFRTEILYKLYNSLSIFLNLLSDFAYHHRTYGITDNPNRQSPRKELILHCHITEIGDTVVKSAQNEDHYWHYDHQHILGLVISVHGNEHHCSASDRLQERFEIIFIILNFHY